MELKLLKIIQDRSRVKKLAYALVLMYILVYFYLTIFWRVPSQSYNYILIPFWSYERVLSYNGGILGSILSLIGVPVNAFSIDSFILLKEIGLNILLYVPFGIIAYLYLYGHERDQMKDKTIIICAACFSLMTELIQLVSRRGLFEFDDIISNIIGCIIGLEIIRSVYKKLHLA